MNLQQEKLLNILEWFHNLCEKYSLRYYMIGGTMLGAARHEGFIPWDDDIDVGLPRNDYEKLRELSKNRIDEGIYSIEFPGEDNPEYSYLYAKIYDTSTTLIEKKRRPIKRGIYLDVFPLDGIGNTLEEGCQNYKPIDRLHMLITMKQCSYRKGRKWWKNVAAILGNILPINYIKKTVKLDKLCSKYNYDDYNYVGNLLSVYRTKEIIDKSIYGTPTLYKFEHLNVYGLEKYDEYLTHIYGNWRQPPPKEKQVSLHDYILMDLNTPYKDYELQEHV